MNSMLVDKSGKIRNYESFRKEVFKVHKKYNKNYLQAEYETAKASAQMSKQWQKYQDDDNCTNLKYRTVGDEKVRDEHVLLDRVVKPKNDPFWDTFLPPNGWRCRCYVVCTKSEVTTDKIEIKVDKRFQNNVGKTNQIFNEKHPYFQIPKATEKQVKTMLEHWKKEYPQYEVRYKAKNGAKVSVSAFADASPTELIGNYKVAIKIADKFGYNVKLTPHVLLDKIKNPEYLINNKISDRKSPKGKNIRSLLKRAKDQGVEVLVIDLHETIVSKQNIINQLAGSFKNPNNYPTIKEVIFVSKDRKELTRIKRLEIKKSKE